MRFLFGPLGRALVALVGFVAMLWGAKAKGKSEGREGALEDVQEVDEKRADVVRRRVADVKRVPDDNIRYRD